MVGSMRIFHRPTRSTSTTYAQPEHYINTIIHYLYIFKQTLLQNMTVFTHVYALIIISFAVNFIY